MLVSRFWGTYLMSPIENKLSVVVPAYNKGYGLYRFLHVLVFELNKLKRDYELIVVNDGSLDNTDGEVQRFQRDNSFNGNAKKIHYFSYPINVGKGFALTYGFTKTYGGTIIFIDADLDLHPRQIQYYLTALEKYKADIVIGSKRHPDSKVSYPPVRKLYSLVYQLLIKMLFRFSIKDTQVGLKVFRREVLENVIPQLVVKAFAFDLELLTVAYHMGFNNIMEVPVDLKHKKFGSTIDWRVVKNVIQDTLAIFYRKNIIKYYDKHIVKNRKVFYPASGHESPA